MLKMAMAVALLIGADSASNILFTRGMKQVRQTGHLRLSQLLAVVLRVAKNPAVVLGVVCAATSFFTLLGLLSRADLSFVQPTFALGYVVSAVGAKYILKEEISPERWIGIAFICAGVALISINAGAD
jgi:transporter family protein